MLIGICSLWSSKRKIISYGVLESEGFNCSSLLFDKSCILYVSSVASKYFAVLEIVRLARSFWTIYFFHKPEYFKFLLNVLKFFIPNYIMSLQCVHFFKKCKANINKNVIKNNLYGNSSRATDNFIDDLIYIRRTCLLEIIFLSLKGPAIKRLGWYDGKRA